MAKGNGRQTSPSQNPSPTSPVDFKCGPETCLSVVSSDKNKITTKKNDRRTCIKSWPALFFEMCFSCPWGFLIPTHKCTQLYLLSLGWLSHHLFIWHHSFQFLHHFLSLSPLVSSSLLHIRFSRSGPLKPSHPPFLPPSVCFTVPSLLPSGK